jgi:hypothetical protein
MAAFLFYTNAVKKQIKRISLYLKQSLPNGALNLLRTFPGCHHKSCVDLPDLLETNSKATKKAIFYLAQ